MPGKNILGRCPDFIRAGFGPLSKFEFSAVSSISCPTPPDAPPVVSSASKVFNLDNSAPFPTVVGDEQPPDTFRYLNRCCDVCDLLRSFHVDGDPPPSEELLEFLENLPDRENPCEGGDPVTGGFWQASAQIVHNIDHVYPDEFPCVIVLSMRSQLFFDVTSNLWLPPSGGTVSEVITSFFLPGGYHGSVTHKFVLS